MSIIGNVSGLSSFYQLSSNLRLATTGSIFPQAANSSQDKHETETVSANESLEKQAGNVRQLTSVDRIIQQELEDEFGIEPWKPGETLSEKLIPSSLFWGAGKTNSGSIDENAEKAFGIFKNHLSEFMLNEGIEADPPIELNVAYDGRVVLKNDHPDREKIENFINDNSELRNLYVGVTSAKNLVAIGKESAEFQKRYAVDPKAAVAEFAHLFSGKYQYNTNLKINGDSWQLNTQSSFCLS